MNLFVSFILKAIAVFIKDVVLYEVGETDNCHSSVSKSCRSLCSALTNICTFPPRFPRCHFCQRLSREAIRFIDFPPCVLKRPASQILLTLSLMYEPMSVVPAVLHKLSVPGLGEPPRHALMLCPEVYSACERWRAAGRSSVCQGLKLLRRRSAWSRSAGCWESSCLLNFQSWAAERALSINHIQGFDIWL